MNPQIWWMVDVGISHALEDYPQIQVQKKCLYLEAHISNALSSVLSVEIKDKIKIEYGLLERANLLWNVLEQIYGSSNSNRSSSSAPENISSSFTYFDQYQEEQSSVQKEELNSTSLGKLECPILIKQKMSWLKKMIALRQVPTSMMMMTQMMSMMNKSSCWSLRNS
jgi:hypothetical protein